MKQAILTISAMCMYSALFAQLFAGSAYIRTVRMALGLQIFLTVVTMLCRLFQMLN